MNIKILKQLKYAGFTHTVIRHMDKTERQMAIMMAAANGEWQ